MKGTRVHDLAPEETGARCAEYAAQGFRLVTMVGTDERERSNAYVLRYFFEREATGERVECRAVLPGDRPVYACATPTLEAADWYERETFDLFGLYPEGHPRPDPLVLHGIRPDGAYPLRKDFPADRPLAPVRRSLDSPRLPDGQFEVPVGPIHAGIIEPGHFRFRMRGETVESVAATLFYTHRGLEKRVEGMALKDGLAVAEKACGACSVSHALSYAQAVESLAGANIPERARWIRLLLAEMERLYNHVGDVGNLCAGIGLSFGVMQGGRLKEALQQLNDDVAGHRYLRGMISVGGVSRDLPPEAIHRVQQVTVATLNEFSGMAEVLLSHETSCDRFTGTGVLSRNTVETLGVVGPAARASGVLRDARADRPYAAYGEVELSIPLYRGGDVMARLQQRISEAYQSGRLIATAAENLLGMGRQGADALCASLPAVDPYAYALGVSESPRGENVHFVMAGKNGTVERLRIRSASYANWPAVPYAVQGNLIADFPLINKSFELCYACCDR